MRQSVVFPFSYVGEALELDHVIVDKNRLINARLGAEVVVADDFILGSMTDRQVRRVAMRVVSQAGAVGPHAVAPVRDMGIGPRGQAWPKSALRPGAEVSARVGERGPRRDGVCRRAAAQQGRGRRTGWLGDVSSRPSLATASRADFPVCPPRRMPMPQA